MKKIIFTALFCFLSTCSYSNVFLSPPQDLVTITDDLVDSSSNPVGMTVYLDDSTPNDVWTFVNNNVLVNDTGNNVINMLSFNSYHIPEKVILTIYLTDFYDPAINGQACLGEIDTNIYQSSNTSNGLVPLSYFSIGCVNSSIHIVGEPIGDNINLTLQEGPES